MNNVILVFHITFLIILVSFIYYWHSHQKNFKTIIINDVIQLYLSLFFLEFTSLVAFKFKGDFYILYYLSWLWPLMMIEKVQEIFLEIKTQKTINLSFLFLGLSVSFILFLDRKNNSNYLFPLGFAYVGISLRLFFTYLMTFKGDIRKLFHDQPIILVSSSFLILRSIFFLNPQIEDFASFDLAISIIFSFIFSLSLNSIELKKILILHQSEIEDVLMRRNQQIYNQSKYSELGMMSAGIAHEINNPLTVIQAKVTQLLRFYKDSSRMQEMREGLEQILYTSERINRTIQGIREFVHQDENITINHFSLKTLMNDVLAFCGQRFKNHGISLRSYGFDQLMLKGHKIQIEQVLLNLLNNAFDAIEFLPEKWIELNAQETEKTVVITVKDSGHGIAKETAGRMMEPFFTTKCNGKGTGLGLVLARGIIEKHGGTLTYISDSPHTTFKIELPKDFDFLSQREKNYNIFALH